MTSKIKITKLLILSLVSIALVLMLSIQPGGAHPPLPLPDFDYNFEKLANNQLIFGQDQWVNGGAGNVAIRTGPDVNQTQTAKGEGGNAGSFAIRPLDFDFYYTSNDTNVVWGAWGYVPSGGNNVTAIGGLRPCYFGPHQLGGLTKLTTFLLRQSPLAYVTGDELLHDHWYEYRVVVDFSKHGGSATLSYRDVTSGLAFKEDNAIKDVNLGLVPDGSGRYRFSDVIIRNDGAGYVDNLHFDAPVPSAACTSRPSGMVSWWPGDGSANDIQGSNNGTLVNGATFALGKVGPAFSLDGANDYVQLSNSLYNPFPATGFTYDFWINPFDIPAGRSRTIISNHHATGNWWNGISMVNGTVEFVLQNGATGQTFRWQTSSTLTPNAWHLIAVAYQNQGDQATDAVIYINGEVQALNTYAIGPTYNKGFIPGYSATDPLGFALGRLLEDTPSANFRGLIDEGEFFNRALTQQEIQAIFNAKSAGKCKPSCLNPPPSGMVAWWPLDETQGSEVVNDSVGGHDGTPMNFGGAVTTIGANGGPEPVTGSYVANSLLFDGAYVEVPDSPPLNFGVDGKEPFTIDAWVNYYPLPQTRPIVSKRASPNGPGYFLSIEPAGGAVFNLTLQIDGVKYTGPAVPSSTWAFVAATRNANGVTLYVGSNNALANPVIKLDSPQDASNTGTPLWIGQSQPVHPHTHSEIDEVEIFNRALDKSEIEAIFNAGSAGKCKSECVPPPTGMIGWWPGDNHPNDIADGNNGTLVGGVSYAPGKVSQAFRFVGSGRVALPNAPSASNFTIEAWVFAGQINSPNGYRTIYAGTHGLWLKFGRINWWNGGDRFNGNTPITTGAWHHIALTYSQGTFTAYLNGMPDGTSSSPGESLPTGAVLGIGGHSLGSGEDFVGLIDELAIYNRALDPDEIKSIADAGSAGRCKPTSGTGTVTIRKNTVGGDDTFGYTTGAGPSAFSITTSGGTGSQTFNNIAAGPTTVTESSPPAGWVFTSLACSDPDSGTTVSGQTANIDLDGGETVICTYTNTKCPAINLNPASGPLPAAGINAPYSQAFTATGGCASAFTFSVTSGTLPPGLTLASNGVLSGTATQLGNSTFNVTATDSCGCSLSQTYTLNAQKNAPNDVKSKTLVISAFRENGPHGAGDEFVEIFNPSDTAVTVGNLPGVSIDGIGVFSNAGNNAGTGNNAVFLRCQIPGTAVIKGKGWYLCGGSDYSLSDLGLNGGTTHSVPDTTIGTGNAAVGDIPDDAGLVLLSVGTNTVSLNSMGFFSGGSAAVVFDSVGFRPYGPGAPATGDQPSLAFKYCEGTCLQPVGDASVITSPPGTTACPTAVGPSSDPSAFPVKDGGTVGGVPVCYGESGQYKIDRRRSAQQFDPVAGNLHRDTDNNADDFILEAPNPASFNVGQSITNTPGVSSVLGAAGPHNSSAPPITGSVLYTQSGFDIPSGPRNAERQYGQLSSIANPQNDPLGVFILRRRFTNGSGFAPTGARYRIDDIATLCGGQTGINGIGSTAATQEARNLRGPDFTIPPTTAPIPSCQGEGSDTGVFTAILKAVNHHAEIVVDGSNIPQLVLGAILEDTSVTGAGIPAVGRHQPFGGGSNSSFVTTAALPLPGGAAGHIVGDGVNGGVGTFATSGTVRRVAFKFGVVKSGRFKLLIGPEVAAP